MIRISMFVFLICLLPATSWAADEQVIFTQSANGTRNTRPFTVADRWELRWDVNGPTLAVFLFTADGERQGILPIITQDKPGSDSSYYPKAGSYYLKVMTDGDWTITVVQLP
jgi:hypothetical protein